MPSPATTRSRGSAHPFGSGADRADLVDALRGLGYRHIGWHIESNEWEPGRTARPDPRSVVDGAAAHGDGAIALLHTWPRPVAPALPRILADLAERGASFVGVDQLDLPPGLEPVGDPRPADIRAAS